MMDLIPPSIINNGSFFSPGSYVALTPFGHDEFRLSKCRVVHHERSLLNYMRSHPAEYPSQFYDVVVVLFREKISTFSTSLNMAVYQENVDGPWRVVAVLGPVGDEFNEELHKLVESLPPSWCKGCVVFPQE